MKRYRIAAAILPAVAALALAAGPASAAVATITTSYGSGKVDTSASGDDLMLYNGIEDRAADSHAVELHWEIYATGGTALKSGDWQNNNGSGSYIASSFYYSPASLLGNRSGYVTFFICKVSGGIGTSCTSDKSVSWSI